MATIKLVANRIPGTNFGHLQLVNGDLELEVQIPSSGILGYWDVRNPQQHSNPEFTKYYQVAGSYKTATINFGEVLVNDAWEVLLNLQTKFKENSINYNTDQNSNSYIYTLLNMVGISLGGYIAQAIPSEVRSFPGLTTNVMFNDEAFSINL